MDNHYHITLAGITLSVLLGSCVATGPVVDHSGDHWSAPVAGLRARLVPSKSHYDPGENIRLKLEFQNISDENMWLDIVAINPVICRATDIMPGGYPFELVITAEPVESSVSTASFRDTTTMTSITAVYLAKNGSITYNIRCVDEIEYSKEEAMEFKPNTPLSSVEIPVQLRFAYRKSGRYRLVASYAIRRVSEGMWNGLLETPPATIELSAK